MKAINWALRRWFYCDRADQGTKAEYAELDIKKTIEFIGAQETRVARHYGCRCSHMILGLSQWRDLLADSKNWMMAENFGPKILPPCKFWGMTVIIIPWFDGVLLLPEDKKTLLRIES